MKTKIFRLEHSKYSECSGSNFKSFEELIAALEPISENNKARLYSWCRRAKTGDKIENTEFNIQCLTLAQAKRLAQHEVDKITKATGIKNKSISSDNQERIAWELIVPNYSIYIEYYLFVNTGMFNIQVQSLETNGNKRLDCCKYNDFVRSAIKLLHSINVI